MTLIVMTLNVMTLNVITLNIMTLNVINQTPFSMKFSRSSSYFYLAVLGLDLGNQDLGWGLACSTWAGIWQVELRSGRQEERLFSLTTCLSLDAFKF